MATMYYDSDCNLQKLIGKTVAVIGYGSQGHALLVLALIDDHVLQFLLNAVAQTNDVAVAGQHEDTLDKLLLDVVAIHIDVADILVLQETNQGLGCRQANGFHVLHSGASL